MQKSFVKEQAAILRDLANTVEIPHIRAKLLELALELEARHAASEPPAADEPVVDKPDGRQSGT